MRKLVAAGAIAVLVAFLASPGMAATVLLSEDFESGYVNGSVAGQTAASGQVWTNVAWNPGDLNYSDTAGVAGGGGLGGHSANGTRNAAIPLGTTVDTDDAENILYVSWDMRCGPSNGGWTPTNMQLERFAGGWWALSTLTSEDWCGWWGCYDGILGRGRIAYPGYTQGGWGYTSHGSNAPIDAAGESAWWHFQVVINLGAPFITADYMAYRIDNPAVQTTHSYNADPYVMWMEFDVIHVWSGTNSATPPYQGIDNLVVITAGEGEDVNAELLAAIEAHNTDMMAHPAILAQGAAMAAKIETVQVDMLGKADQSQVDGLQTQIDALSGAYMDHNHNKGSRCRYTGGPMSPAGACDDDDDDA